MNVSRNFFKVLRDAKGNYSRIVYDIVPLRGNRDEIKAEAYVITPEIQTAFTDTKYNFNNFDMDDENVTTLIKS